MIVTVTLNPALDKTAKLNKLEVGELNRIKDVQLDAAGKGINVSKVVSALGGETVALGFIGGSTGQEIIKDLDSLGVNHDFIDVPWATRTNLKLLDCEGNLTEINESGGEITEELLKKLEDRMLSYLGDNTTYVFSGSIAPGLEQDVYNRLITLVKEKGAKAYLDADGIAFKEGIKAIPTFIKPNRFEITEYFNIDRNMPIPQLAEYCKKFIDMGIEKVALSLGEEGAMFTDGKTTVYAPALDVKMLSPVGAGDSVVASIAYGENKGLSWKESSILALATSAASVTNEGTKPPNRQQIDNLINKVKLEQLDS